jgi:hypothetical protein
MKYLHPEDTSVVLTLFPTLTGIVTHLVLLGGIAAGVDWASLGIGQALLF